MKGSTLVGVIVSAVIGAAVYGIVVLWRAIFGAEQPCEQSGVVVADLHGVFELEEEECS
jgi:hypothetical protein